MCFGACDSLCSFVFGKLARITGRIALFGLGMITRYHNHCQFDWGFDCIINAVVAWFSHTDPLHWAGISGCSEKCLYPHRTDLQSIRPMIPMICRGGLQRWDKVGCIIIWNKTYLASGQASFWLVGYLRQTERSRDKPSGHTELHRGSVCENLANAVA